MKSSLYIRLIAFLAIGLTSFSTASSQDGGTGLATAIKEKRFVFTPQTATSMGGPTRQVNNFDLRVLGDSLISYLPFFGRAYSPVGPNDRGLDFTSSDFGYAVVEKKNGWELTLEPRDARNVRQMILTVFTSGYAMLQVNSTNRQGMSYYGTVAFQEKE